MKENCIFCKIINGEAKAEFVSQGEDIVAFRDINPSAPVHILIIPKKHIRSVNDLEKEDGALLSKMFLTAKEIAKDQARREAYLAREKAIAEAQEARKLKAKKQPPK